MYLVRMRENTDENSSKYGHFSSSESQSEGGKNSKKTIFMAIKSIPAPFNFPHH